MFTVYYRTVHFCSKSRDFAEVSQIIGVCFDSFRVILSLNFRNKSRTTFYPSYSDLGVHQKVRQISSLYPLYLCLSSSTNHKFLHPDVGTCFSQLKVFYGYWVDVHQWYVNRVFGVIRQDDSFI